MSEEITRGDMSLHTPELVPENIHRVKQADADDSRNAREQFSDAQEEQKDNETSGRDGDAQDKSSPEKSVISVRNWEAIHDDIILSETAQRLMDQSHPVEPAESNHGKAEEKSPADPVPRIHLTA
jgi:hypothetical protein